MGEFPDNNGQPLNPDVQPPEGWTPDSGQPQAGENAVPTPEEINGSEQPQQAGEVVEPSHEHAETTQPEETETTRPADTTPETPAVAAKPMQAPQELASSADQNGDEDKPPVNEFVRRSSEPDLDQGRWDEQKAQTMASIVYNDKPDTQFSTASLLDEQQATIDKLFNQDGKPNTEYEDGPSAKAHLSLDRAKEELALATEGGNETEIARLAGKVQEKQGIYEAEKEGQAISLREQLRLRGESIDNESDRLLPPFEELYDSNPDRYASMPTSGFVELVKEFTGIDKSIATRAAASQNLRQFEELIRTAAKRERAYGTGRLDSPDAIANLKKYVLEAVNGIGEGLEHTSAEFDDILKDGYDKTPRQINDGLLGFVDATLAKAGDLSKADQQRRLVMLGKAKPAEAVDLEN